MEKHHKPSHLRKNSRKRCLSDLQNNRKVDLFVDAPFDTLPENLRSYIEQLQESGGNVKKFQKRSQAYLKIFTFQYLTLCFGDKNRQSTVDYLQLIYELIEKQQFQFILPQSPHQLSQQSHMSLKNIISQYLNYMSENTESVLASLQKYPLILQIFIAFFKTMLYLGDVFTFGDKKQTQSKQQIFEFLTSYFEVQATATNQMIIFKDSKVTLFQKQPKIIGNKIRRTLSEQQPIYMIYHEDPIYKIDDSKFSELLNKQEQAVYKSGISSVKCLISNIDIKSNEEIEPESAGSKNNHSHSHSGSNKIIKNSDKFSSKQKIPQNNSIKIKMPISHSSNQINKKQIQLKQNNQKNTLQKEYQCKNMQTNYGFGQVKQCGSQFIENHNVKNTASQNSVPQTFEQFDIEQQQQQICGSPKLIKNLRSIDPKNVSYSYNQDSVNMKQFQAKDINISSKKRNILDDKQNIESHNVIWQSKSKNSQQTFSNQSKQILKSVPTRKTQDQSQISQFKLCNQLSIKHVKHASDVKALHNQGRWTTSSPFQSQAHLKSIIDKYDFKEISQASKFNTNKNICKQMDSVQSSLRNSAVNKLDDSYQVGTEKSILKDANKGRISSIHYTPVYTPVYTPSHTPTHTPTTVQMKKPKISSKWLANQNITKQFTNSFLLNLVTEPYRTLIKQRKDKARESRKNARVFMF